MGKNMINSYLIGTKKNGCFINNDEKYIQYFEFLSLYDKIMGKKGLNKVAFKDIDNITIGYTINRGIRMGLVTLHLNILTLDSHLYNFQFLFMNTKREELEKFIRVLIKSNLKIIDPHNILEQIITSKYKISYIIDMVDKQVKNKHTCNDK